MTESTIKYIISRHVAEIKACVCTKETKHHVWLESKDWRGRVSVTQLRKNGDVFGTWAEAHDELMSRAESHLNAARRHLERAQGFIVARLAYAVARRAYAAGADAELELSGEWLEKGPYGFSIAASAPDLISSLRAARRPTGRGRVVQPPR